MHIIMSGMPDAAAAMNEEQFWNIISMLDWSNEGNDDAVIEPSVQELSKMPASAILSFFDLLSEKLYLLDGRNYAENAAPYGESISSDLFLYARCGVIANGRSFYESVLKKPSAFPQNLFFEALLDIPERAWFRKTGASISHQPKYIFETGFNPNGWGSDTISL
jgi:Protein of unknown function (DUF4240)